MVQFFKGFLQFNPRNCKLPYLRPLYLAFLHRAKLGSTNHPQTSIGPISSDSVGCFSSVGNAVWESEALPECSPSSSNQSFGRSSCMLVLPLVLGKSAFGLLELVFVVRGLAYLSVELTWWCQWTGSTASYLVSLNFNDLGRVLAGTSFFDRGHHLSRSKSLCALWLATVKT